MRQDQNMSPSPALLLIGPAAAGKSTIGTLTADLLGIPFVDLDEIDADYYAEVDWSIDRLVRRSDEVGRVAAEREWELARAHAVRRAVEDYPDAVLALGAGHSSYTDAACFADVQAAAAKVPTVVLLLPKGERAGDLAELRRRSLTTKGTDWVSSGHDFLAEWLDDPGMHALATDLVITGTDTPRETALRVAGLVQAP
jgi:hypothetical protein